MARRNIEERYIRVQTAVENVTIQQAIHDGDWYAATKGADNLNKHRLEIETICQMRDDYAIVTGQLSVLQKEEYEFYSNFFRLD